jgi:FkbM family methyltransferase
MYGLMKWKLMQHSDFVKLGMNHNLFMEFLLREYRKSTYEKWRELPLIKAVSDGFIFSGSTPSIALREIFIEEIYNVDGFKPESGQMVIDIGANYGDSAIWWAKAFGTKVIAFEPLVNVFNALEENIKLNNVDVTAYNLALGNGEEISGSSDGNMFSSGGNIKLKSEKLDSFSFERVDLLKIDVEGFEMDVLLGAENTIRQFKPRIILETHSRELRKKCHAFLSSLGYSLKVEGRTVTIKSPGMDKITNLFYSF